MQSFIWITKELRGGSLALLPGAKLLERSSDILSAKLTKLQSANPNNNTNNNNNNYHHRHRHHETSTEDSSSMISVLYSLWETHDHNVIVTMMLSAYTWASGLYSSVPDYAVIDAALGLWTLLHIFVASTYLTVADAFYKKTLLQLHYKLIAPLYSKPLLIPIVNFFTILLTARLCYYAYHHDEDGRATLRAVFAVHTWACSIMMQRMSSMLVKLGVDYAMNVEKDIEKHDIKAWKAPPKWTSWIFSPPNIVLRPVLTGAENIPHDKPGFYVMNHALYGLEMAPFVATVYNQTNVFLRGLSDHFHFGQLHGEMIRFFGGVDGTRDNVDCLMENQDNILVYPGGGNEIMKPCDVPRYTLMWKQRLGFARMAIKHGYPVVPCCSVGTEDMFDRIFDIDLGFMRKGFKVPVSAPILPHKLQRVYFWVGEPIPTAHLNGDWQNDEAAREIRDKVRASLEAGIQEMLEKQANDPNRYFLNHIGNSVAALFGCGPCAVTTKTVEDSEPVPASKKAD
ncbi:Acyltransferase [Seminavis robusta]|uniref:Acyltransferase n=1 Tax=Seminavis robusta TaxID=568900 RepID=A0A9N8F0L3_9STRA|nr:Acyltransferase [Seminavis robusta]|eukprot:Sro2473_g328690.1 Acyltransferase (510) ;mRNA; f:3049-4578